MAKDLSKKNRGAQHRDALLEETLTLAAATSSVSSAVIDLGTGDYKNKNISLFVENTSEIPSAALDNTEVITVDILSGTTTSPTVAALSAIPYLTGNGSATAAGKRLIVRVPPQIERYVKIRVNSGTGTALTSEQVLVGVIVEDV
jgi:hypothetical protein